MNGLLACLLLAIASLCASLWTGTNYWEGHPLCRYRDLELRPSTGFTLGSSSIRWRTGFSSSVYAANLPMQIRITPVNSKIIHAGFSLYSDIWPHRRERTLNIEYACPNATGPGHIPECALGLVAINEVIVAPRYTGRSLTCRCRKLASRSHLELRITRQNSNNASVYYLRPTQSGRRANIPEELVYFRVAVDKL